MNDNSQTSNLKALGLISGGLDSLTACLLIKQQGIEVIGLHFESPFCQYKTNLEIFHEKLGIEVHTLSLEDDFLDIIQNPKFGYGRHLNPCVDCRIYILKKAKEFMRVVNADIIFTGEVLNQRPKSQHLKALYIVEKESGLEGKLLRPLSALQLKPTIYEEIGLIVRSELLGIKGRSRKTQLELVRKHGLLQEYYACGGCLLTDENYSNRMKDSLKFNNVQRIEDMNILKYGRHFRFKDTKIIVGRDETENNMLIQFKKPEDFIMEVQDVPGPVTIIQGSKNEESLNYAASLTLRYSDLNEPEGRVFYGRDYENLDNSIIAKLQTDEFLKRFIL
ncbi:MAG: tRNA 4-thiouridine(8) synthase ThiI [Candidatus Hermodarchaeota archaeon]